ncbi:MAG: hypothetical protein LBG22_05245 [Treponema sp.]|jgi:hypothetical protein|nr:hypothetical protein [Treponema sp.]
MKKMICGIISFSIILISLYGQTNTGELIDTILYDKRKLPDNVRFDSPNDYLGKWMLLDDDGESYNSNVFFVIYNEEDKYKFIRKYYSDVKIGNVIWTEYNSLEMMLNKDSDIPNIPWRTVGKPQWNGNTYVVLIDNEGPLGFFQRLLE